MNIYLLAYKREKKILKTSVDFLTILLLLVLLNGNIKLKLKKKEKLIENITGIV